MYNAYSTRQTVTYNDLTRFMSYGLAKKEMSKKNELGLITNTGTRKNASFNLTEKGLIQYNQIPENHWVKVEKLLKPKSIAKDLKVNLRYVRDLIKGLELKEPYVSHVMGKMYVYGCFDKLFSKYEAILRDNALNKVMNMKEAYLSDINESIEVKQNFVKLKRKLDRDNPKGEISLMFYRNDSEADDYNKNPVIFDVRVYKPVDYSIIEDEVLDFLTDEIMPLKVDDALRNETSNYEITALSICEHSLNPYNINRYLNSRFSLEDDKSLFEVSNVLYANESKGFVRLVTVYECRIKPSEIPAFIKSNSPSAVLNSFS